MFILFLHKIISALAFAPPFQARTDPVWPLYQVKKLFGTALVKAIGHRRL